MFSTILLYGGLFLGGLIAGLKVIAPLTKTKVDDSLLDYALRLEGIIESLGGQVPHAETPAPVVAARPDKV